MMIEIQSTSPGPLLQHPTRFVWDFWYWFEKETEIFHVFFLNANRRDASNEAHHFHAIVGYALTRDFESIEWIDDEVFAATPRSWDNSSIWTGDVVEGQGELLFFYTSRDARRDDGMTQSIGSAHGSPRCWTRTPCKIDTPNDGSYLKRSDPREATIHAWRDPFVFRANCKAWMVVAAKEASAAAERRGALALLEASDFTLTKWKAHPVWVAPGWFAEMEVPQILRNEGGLIAFFSTPARYDKSPVGAGRGGLQALHVRLPPETMPPPEHCVIVPESEGVYACRVIPELHGEVVGFDIRNGGLRKAGVRVAATGLDRTFR